MTLQPLTRQDLDDFVEYGLCRLPAAFSRRQARAACDRLWARMEQKARIRRCDPATWPASYDIVERLEDQEILACFSDRLADSIEQLVGDGRWNGERHWGFWPVNFSFGADQRKKWPTTGWHIDGNWFRHFINSPQQGLLIIGLFTDIREGWGGTAVAKGSHKRTARILAEHPEGLPHLELFQKVLVEPLGNFDQIIGEAGDVILCHPFLFHTIGFKRSGPPRIISNTEAGLRQPMNLERIDHDHYSILERSIRNALGEAPAPATGALPCRF